MEVVELVVTLALVATVPLSMAKVPLTVVFAPRVKVAVLPVPG